MIRELPSWPGYGLGPGRRVHSRRLTSGRLGCLWRPLRPDARGRLRLRRAGMTLTVRADQLEVRGG